MAKRSRPLLHFASLFLLVSACDRPGGLVTDDLGRRLAIPQRIDRIVTLAPNVTEIVAFVDKQHLLVGADTFSNFPPEIRSLPKVGGVSPSVERIVELRPDLVLASSSVDPAALGRALESAGIPLFAVRTDRLADISRAIDRVEDLLGTSKGEHSRRLTRAIESERRSRPRPPMILFLASVNPLYVAGRATYIDDLITLTGGANAVAAHVTGWPQYSLEALIASQPEIILHPASLLSGDERERLLQADPRWRELEAVRLGSWFAVDDDIFTRPGPRVAAAAGQLNGILDRWEAGQSDRSR
ncbi:MAG TPA: helical backbone metal receptor [Thermoanaerobaculia bacterium]|nr:helical backbone metal receptor [Thermoanaerobaculia bacterium]